MSKSVLDTVRKRQALKFDTCDNPPPARPEVMYIGCSDARLSTVRDIGFPHEKVFIVRNMGPLLHEDPDMDAHLDFFLNTARADEGVKKSIIAANHTDCGALRACQHGAQGKSLPAYIGRFKDIRKTVMDEAEKNGLDDQQIHHALIEETARHNMRYLRAHPLVQEAIAAGTLEDEPLHSWIIQTGNKRILTLNPNTNQFEPMGQSLRNHVGGRDGGGVNR